MPGIKTLIRNFFPEKLKGFNQIKKYFKNNAGLEIGGPSEIFNRRKYIPVYPLIKRLDGVNFSSSTIWENRITKGFTYKFSKRVSPGYQYIEEGANLSVIKDDTYDFILASHSLEHIANPLKALKEWLRVLKRGGVLLAILPDKRYTFDHKRPVTAFGHLLEDYRNNTQEDDLTHVDEIRSLHDLDLDPGIINKDDFPSRCLDNINNRCLHHHIFDTKLLRETFTHLNLEILSTDFSPPYHQIILGIKK